MKTTVFLTIMILAFSVSGFAQVPEGVNFQAVARDYQGQPLEEATIKVRISILHGGESGNQIYREVHSVTTNEYGVFNLVIGKGSSGDRFRDIDWTDPLGKWVKIEIDPSGSSDYELLGSQQLMTVPFAFHAKTASSAPPVLPFLNQDEINALDNPAKGLLIFNTSTSKLNFYGEDGWFAVQAEKIETAWVCGKPFTDGRDGKSYRTTKIGNQCWMAENLNFGTQIQGSVNMSNNGIIEKYCYQNIASSCDSYGGLYQWDELMNYSTVKGSVGICPDGWHVPTDEEFQEQEIALGMSAYDAGRANIWRGTDQGLQMAPGGGSGFDLLYSGRRVTGGLYTALDDYEYTWTSTQSADAAWRRCYQANLGTIGRYNTFPKEYGMSVRCVKD